MEEPVLDKPVKGRRGRPRTLDLDRLVDAAIEMGLSNLDMDALASRLGVGAGTIYGYVRSRDELVSLAAGRIFGKRLLLDTGQSWQEAIRQMAASGFEVFISDRAMLGEFIKGTYSTLVGDAYIAALVNLLMSRGFSRTDAQSLYFEVSQTVLGAALAQLQRIANPGGALSYPEAMGDYHRTVERIIKGYEDEHRAA